MSPLAACTRALLAGDRFPASRPEPVAWVNRKGTRRIFYTSLGHPADFENPAFRRLLKNAVFWALDRLQPPAIGSPCVGAGASTGHPRRRCDGDALPF